MKLLILAPGDWVDAQSFHSWIDIIPSAKTLRRVRCVVPEKEAR